MADNDIVYDFLGDQEASFWPATKSFTNSWRFEELVADNEVVYDFLEV